ncbi:MAG: acyl-CoA dehydrogenase family protein [Arenicella sp.]|nr:acyl-CoA dehydrogenase family protein [Arenicella sp.]
MKINLTVEEKAFEANVKDFLASELPSNIKQKVLQGRALKKEDHVRWQKILYEQGWAAIDWPYEYGGCQWSAIQKHIWAAQCAISAAPEVIPFGLDMVAPVIYTYGNDAQKERFLPDILASNVWWCQGYSEPEAGSDLASLKTTAVIDGDYYIVTGVKTWITYAQHADWIFCLVRTGSPQTVNNDALSFLLIPMDSPGITVTPIISMDGAHEMNEVVFENVGVPIENRIGEEGKGWTYSKTLLNHERAKLAHVAVSKNRLQELKKAAHDTLTGHGSLMDDPRFSAKLARTEIELTALEFTEFRTLIAESNDTDPGPESSILKIVGTGVSQSIDELFVELAGLYVLPFIDPESAEKFAGTQIIPKQTINTARLYFNNRKASLFGGSSEIQKNIICKDVLGFDLNEKRGEK